MNPELHIFTERAHLRNPTITILMKLSGDGEFDELRFEAALQTLRNVHPLSALKAAGYTAKENRKHISVCAPGQKRPTRLVTLGGDYTEAAIRARLGMVKLRTGSSDNGMKTRVNMLVDIQEKIREPKPFCTRPSIMN